MKKDEKESKILSENAPGCVLKVPSEWLIEEAILGIIIDDELIYKDCKTQLKQRKQLHDQLLKSFASKSNPVSRDSF